MTYLLVWIFKLVDVTDGQEVELSSILTLVVLETDDGHLQLVLLGLLIGSDFISHDLTCFIQDGAIRFNVIFRLTCS